jgi:hypothetical protein
MLVYLLTMLTTESIAPNNPGKYSRKHPAGTRPDPAIASGIERVAEDGRVGCAVAHDLAAELAVTPAEIGKTMDLLDYRINKCQMGIFGYEPHKKTLETAETVSDELRDRLQSAAPEGRISCVSCWEIAQAMGLEKITVAEACERLGLKIKPCQLGAY